MSSSVSPYALLCASKPKRAATVVTPYDLYSLSQEEGAFVLSASLAKPLAPMQEDSPNPEITQPPALPPKQRTHYISAIQMRHQAAVRASTPFSHQP